MIILFISFLMGPILHKHIFSLLVHCTRRETNRLQLRFKLNTYIIYKIVHRPSTSLAFLSSDQLLGGLGAIYSYVSICSNLISVK